MGNNVTTVSRRQKLYEGKANTIYATDNEFLLELESTDRISAGNGEKKDVVDGKGLTNNAISTKLFEFFNEHEIPTHYVEKGSNEYSKVVRKAKMIKLEVIGRFIAAGSFCKRYNIEQGKVFDEMIFELSYKDDSLGDPFISENVAINGLELISENDLYDIEDYTYEVGHIAKDFFNECGLTLVDFKVEFGYDVETGELMLCDEFSPDTCRLWDENGNSWDKDVFRNDLGNVSETYKKLLDLVQSN